MRGGEVTFSGLQFNAREEAKMAVLIEAKSVVIRFSDVQARFPDGVTGFKAAVPNDTFCTDGRLVRVGFLSPDEATEFMETLAAAGLELLPEPDSLVAVVDQVEGLTYPWPWVTVHEFDVPGCPIKVKGAVITGQLPGGLLVPDGWTPDRYASIADSFRIDPATLEGQELRDYVLELTEGRYSSPDEWALGTLELHEAQVAESMQLMPGAVEEPGAPMIYIRVSESEFEACRLLLPVSTVPLEIYYDDSDEEGVLVAVRRGPGGG